MKQIDSDILYSGIIVHLLGIPQQVYRPRYCYQSAYVEDNSYGNNGIIIIAFMFIPTV